MIWRGLRHNAAGKLQVSPLQKVVASMRQLKNGIESEATEEYLPLGDSTALESLKDFCAAVVA